jgi:hypothetical protein
MVPDTFFTQGYRIFKKGGPDSLSIGAAKPHDDIREQKIASCAYGTPIAELSGIPCWIGTCDSPALTPCPSPKGRGDDSWMAIFHSCHAGRSNVWHSGWPLPLAPSPPAWTAKNLMIWRKNRIGFQCGCCSIAVPFFLAQAFYAWG